eukprot:jgi/Chrzof1/8319/Cz03g06020.t1
MALAIHAGRGAAVLQLTNKHCKERVVTHLYLCLNSRATAGTLALHDTQLPRSCYHSPVALTSQHVTAQQKQFNKA